MKYAIGANHGILTISGIFWLPGSIFGGMERSEPAGLGWNVDPVGRKDWPELPLIFLRGISDFRGDGTCQNTS